MNKQQLAAKIWESANKMRSKIEANEYKDYILGFIFYKFLSDKEVKYLKELGFTDADLPAVTEDQTEIVTDVQNKIGYFIAYENLFSTWLAKGSDFNVGNVRDALSAFSRLINPTHKKVFEKIFDTLQTGLSKLGDGAGSQTKAISDLIHLIKDIPMDGKQDYDVLGFIYEYLISNFAANAGKKAGEFYTPHEVSLLMSEIVADHLKDRTEIKIYDPTSGSGSLLINIGKSVAKHMGNGDQIKYYAQELKENTYNLTRMNLVMRGILPSNIVTRNGDTLEDDWPYFDESDPVGTYDPLYVDAVVSNPPYSQNWNPQDKENEPRYKEYGLAPKGKADYAFLLHDLYHIKPDGIMTIVLPHGVLFRGGEEGEIRKHLIENNKIDAIIGLPANIFFGTGIPTIIMVLKQKRENTDILIIDASKGFEKVGKNNKLRASDIKRIVDTVTGRKTIAKYSRVVSRDEVRKNDYNLNIPRYVDSSEKAESWDIYASMYGGVPVSEVEDLAEYWTAFPTLKDSLFSKKNAGYLLFVPDDIKAFILSHADTEAFESKFKTEFGNFAEYLNQELITDMERIPVSKEENTIATELFKRLSDVPLVDPYEAYQILDQNWAKIAVDLEIIQTEGTKSITVVDPNMVIKKKDNKETEVQEGWIGRVLPFELVQKELLSDDVTALKLCEDRLAAITSDFDSLLEELPEDEKSKDFVNDDSTAFVPAAVKKALKAKDEEAEVLAILKKVDALVNEEKSLKKDIKDKTASLQITTKKTIESLSEEDALALLSKKWIEPMVTEISALPLRIVDTLTAKLEALAKKYQTTFEDVEKEIADTEASLTAMIDQLTGSDFDMQGLLELKKLLGGE
ncbi:type I restriction-modification system M subunit [Ruminococcus sp. CAG:382]|nr:type I restriction-modification system M subunit [Ruminococcus sp. CAG:382]